MIMLDSTDPGAYPADAQVVARYIDGHEGLWTPADETRLAKCQVVTFSVLGSTEALVQDTEAKDQTPATASRAALGRVNSRLPAAIYCNESTFPALVSAMRNDGLSFRSAADWPAPGAYYGAADPTGSPHATVAWCPVEPVFVQYLWTPALDYSWVNGTFPSLLKPVPDTTTIEEDPRMILTEAVDANGDVHQVILTDQGVRPYSQPGTGSTLSTVIPSTIGKQPPIVFADVLKLNGGVSPF